MPSEIVHDRSAIRAAVLRAGGDAVLKASAPSLLHKSDRGLVRVGVGVTDAERVFAELLGAADPGAAILMQPRLMGIELIVGARRDPDLGAFVLVGLGGVAAELIEDVAVSPAPVSPEQALKLIHSLRGAPIITGYRGSPPADVDSLARLVAAVARLVASDPWLVELDLNPVFLPYGGGQPVAADVRAVRRAPPERGAAPRRRDLRPLFAPRSIAVVGASTDANKLGSRIVRYLAAHGYPGVIHPVHPSVAEIQGYPAVRSIGELPPLDLALVAVPARQVAGAVEAAVEAGTAAIVVHSAGLSDQPDEKQVARALVDRVRSAGAVLVGPNSMGIMSVPSRTHAAFSGTLEAPELAGGRICFLSQSGAIASSLLGRIIDAGFGISRWVSSGNESDLVLADYLAYAADDDDTDVIVVFAEAIREGSRFAEATRRARGNGKHVLVYKSGRSLVGQEMVRSHTGALAGQVRLYSAFLEDCGAVEVPDLSSLYEGALVLASEGPSAGRRLGVVTMSGGAGTLCADTAEDLGLDVPELPPEAQTALREWVPASGAVRNPVDVTANAMTDPAKLVRTLHAVLDQPGLDMIIVQLTTNADPAAERIASGIIEARATAGARKPIIVSRLGAESVAPGAMARYREARIPVLTWPESAVRAAWVLERAGRPLPARTDEDTRAVEV